MDKKSDFSLCSGPNLGSVSSPLPSLSPDLISLYGVMSVSERRMFRRIYRYLWDDLNRQTVEDAGQMSYLWVLSSLVSSSPLAPGLLSLLSYLYLMSEKGQNAVKSAVVYDYGALCGLGAQTLSKALNRLKLQGYLKRSTRDHKRPYVQEAQHSRHPIWITLTDDGVKIIEDIERNYRRMIMTNSLNQITGNKKAR